MKLYYFDCYGRAEPTRILLWHAKVDYENITFDWSQFPKIKAEKNFEFNQVPVLEMDGEQYSQSYSILKLLGKMYGYYPEDPKQAYKVDSMLQAGQDLQENWWHTFLEKNEEKKQKDLENYVNLHLKRYYTVMQNRLLKNSTQKYLVGDKPTIADFDSAHLAYTYFLNENNAFYKQ